MEAAIKNNAKNNMENKEKLVSHLDELVDSMTTKPGCGPVFSGLDVLPDMIKEYENTEKYKKKTNGLRHIHEERLCRPRLQPQSDILAASLCI